MDRDERLRRAWPWLAAVVVVVVAAIAIVALRWPDPKMLSPAEIDSVVAQAVDDGLAEARSEPPDSAKVYEAIAPSLVAIRADGAATAGSEGTGAGVIVNSAGAILTARHVVAGARVVR